ncbi:hypothetical protein IEO21_03657 [Rhodonia placenta]|uniref:Actin-like ATPase domain-containing protein n=1 Tax=Rhodonia placenta TaxID=104341 RepID=A0A8H7P5A3_9APHY|nr:hypothetical protein IEO21_03657 [Postia placenta]
MVARKPYPGAHRKLVLAFDIGTTFSGVSYSILDPGEIPRTLGVHRFPGQEANAGDSKIPSVLWYDQAGEVRAVGAQAQLPQVVDQAVTEEWMKVEWFKLHLRPVTEVLPSDREAQRYSRMAPLPERKTIIDILADFMKYLYSCTRTYVIETHASGSIIWASLEAHTDFVLSHPNGWGGSQQEKMRRAAIQAALIPDTPEGRARVQFVTEGEASIHFCISNGLAVDAIKDGKTIMVVDAGGGTVDISTYALKNADDLTMEEVAPPDCDLHRQYFVCCTALKTVVEKLADSKYGNEDDIEEMFKHFDGWAKPVFQSPEEPSYIRFGSMRDKDLAYGIRNGQLTLSGTEMSSLFEPSIVRIKDAIHNQLSAAQTPVNILFLVGGFAANPWLFSQLKQFAQALCLDFARPDSHTNKAVAEGSLSYYLDHFVSVRVARFTYGTRMADHYVPSNPEHQRRHNQLFTWPSGLQAIRGGFGTIMQKASPSDAAL